MTLDRETVFGVGDRGPLVSRHDRGLEAKADLTLVVETERNVVAAPHRDVVNLTGLATEPLPIGDGDFLVSKRQALGGHREHRLVLATVGPYG